MNLKLVWLGALLILFSACGGEKSRPLDSARKPGIWNSDQGSTTSTPRKRIINVKEIKATSFLKEKYNYYAYHPWKAIDGDPGTAWNEGVTGPGIGESLIIRLSQPEKFNRLEIMPGFYDERWYKKNNRIKQLQVKAGDLSFDADFDDGMTLKTIKLPQIVEADEIRLTIKDVYKGDAFDETCISEVRIFYGEERLLFDFHESNELIQAEQQYPGIHSRLKSQFPKYVFYTPAGKVFTFSGIMGEIYSEYFFDDGRYILSHVFCRPFIRESGTWRMDTSTGSLMVKITKTAEVRGLGDYACYPPCHCTYYTEYQYNERDVNQIKEIEWNKYLFDLLSDPNSSQLARSITAIKDEDKQYLPEKWTTEAQQYIAGSIAEYHKCLAFNKKQGN